MEKEMSYFVTQATLEKPTNLAEVKHHASSFPDLTFPRPAQWVQTALAQLWELEQSGRDIRGLGDVHIAAQTAIRVRKLLSRMGRIEPLPWPVVNVMSGGGVTLTWGVGNKEVKYTFWPGGVLTYWKEEHDQIIAEADVDEGQDFDPAGPVEWLLKS
jgi:hypothetical protein